MKFDENRRVILETAFIRLASPETNFTESAVMARLKKLEENKERITYVRVQDEKKDNDGNESAKELGEDKENISGINNTKKIEEIKLSPASLKEIEKVISNWKTIAASVNMSMRSIMSESKLIPVDNGDEKHIEVQIDSELYEMLYNPKSFEALENKLSEQAEKIINKKVNFKIVSAKESRYSKEVVWKLDDAYDKITMEIEEE